MITKSLKQYQNEMNKLYNSMKSSLANYSCGAELAESINPEIYNDRLKMAKLYFEMKEKFKITTEISWLEELKPLLT